MGKKTSKKAAFDKRTLKAAESARKSAKKSAKKSARSSQAALPESTPTSPLRDYSEDEDRANSDYDGEATDHPLSGRSSSPSSSRGENVCALDGDTSPAGDGEQNLDCALDGDTSPASDGEQNLDCALDGDTSPAGDGKEHQPPKGNQSVPAVSSVTVAVHGSDSEESEDSEKEANVPVSDGVVTIPQTTRSPARRLFTDVDAKTINKEKDLKVSKSNTSPLATSTPTTKGEEQLDRLRNRVELDAYEQRQQMTAMQAMITRLQEQLQEKASHEPLSAHDRLKDPPYAERFQILVKSGHDMDAVHNALQATMESGKVSVQRADAYLKLQGAAEAKAALDRANAAASAMETASIAENSALAKLLGEFPDRTDIVLKVRQAHIKSRAKAAHSGKPALCAANLVETTAIKNDGELSRHGHVFLCRVASAVSEDCVTCKELRDKLEKEEIRKQHMALATKLKAEANAARIRDRSNKPSEGQLADQPFKFADSKRDVTLPRRPCKGCGIGYTGAANTKWLLFCNNCRSGYHERGCTVWQPYLRICDGKDLYACRACMDEREFRIARGDAVEEWKLLYEGQDGTAPTHGEAAEEELHIPPPTRQPTATSGTTRPPQTPKDPHIRQPNFTFGSDTDHNETLSNLLGVSKLNATVANVSSARTSIQAKDYFQWEPVPKDWAPKPDPAKPDDAAPEHPEKGWGKLAYANWRRKNVTNRDSVRAANSDLGPLTRGLSQDMKITIGTQLLLEAKMPGIWERSAFLAPSETDEWVAKFVAADPSFKWVEQLCDETLLEVLDRKFGVKNADLFLTKRFTPNLPIADAQGNVNYHVADFNRWATEWQTELTELQLAGVQFGQVNLRQTLLNALSTNKTLWDEASRYNSQNPYLLIGHLREWVRKEDESARAERNKKRTLLGQDNHSSGPTHQSASQLQTSQSMLLLTQSVAALSSQISHLQQQGSGRAAAVNTAGKEFTSSELKPVPPHMRVCRDSNKARCNGCGNVWERRRAIPCFKGCKYTEHPNYNHQPCTQDYSAKDSLTWKDFRTRFPSITPPPTFIAWEKREATFEATKRGRDGKPGFKSSNS